MLLYYYVHTTVHIDGKHKITSGIEGEEKKVRQREGIHDNKIQKKRRGKRKLNILRISVLSIDDRCLLVKVIPYQKIIHKTKSCSWKDVTEKTK